MLSTTQNTGLLVCLLLALACVGETRAAELAITNFTWNAYDQKLVVQGTGMITDGETCVQQAHTITVDKKQGQILGPVSQEDNTGNQIGFSMYVPLFFGFLGLLDLLTLYRSV